MALSIVAILTAVALPTFQYVIQSVQVGSAVNSFLSDIRFARSEAIRRGGSVVLCRSDDPQAAAPVCNDATGAAGWASGWIIFQDLGLTSAGGDKDPDDPLLRQQAPLLAIGVIAGK
ncbi:GspH/FimT family pseudopilin, partial [Roseateles sp. GG27B]